MQGGLVDGGRDSGTASVTATGAESRGSAPSTATDGGQPRPEPRNIVAGAIAGTDWTHDDVTVALSFVSTVAIVLWLLLEVTDR